MSAGDFPIDVDRIDRVVSRLVSRQTVRTSQRARLARLALKALGCDWRPFEVGSGLRMPHATTGSVVHSRVRLGANVTVFHGVTLGRSDSWVRPTNSEGLVIGDDVIIGANATVLFRSGEFLIVGRGTVIGAGAVLTQSTGEREIWAGVPARVVGKREP